MSKYEPPREDGTKGYVVTMRDWGRTVERVVYAVNSADARFKAAGRSMVGRYVVNVKRKLAVPSPERGE